VFDDRSDHPASRHTLRGEKPYHRKVCATSNRWPDARKGSAMTSATTEEEVRIETIEVKGDNLLHKIKEIVHEGNVRRITITSEEGNKLLEIPLTLGVVGVVLLPVFAAVGALAALVTDCTLKIERVEKS
jgi:hypothetical protein